jgi:hypothetical protein
MNTRREYQPGALWIGGADNFIVQILGPGHKPGLTRVRVYEPDGDKSSELEFVGNQIARRHVWAGSLQEQLREVIQQGRNVRALVAQIREKCEREALRTSQPKEREMTKDQLFTAFGRRAPIVIKGLKFSVINKIAHEDGSGKSFNVTGYLKGIETTVHVRTID